MLLQDILTKNALLKNMHAGKRCFIIGNGPSLAAQDLTLLKDEICIVVNSFHKHTEAKTINPNYWVLADPDFWGKPESELMPLLEQVHNLGIPTKLFMPTGSLSCLSQINTGALIDLHFFHYHPGTGIDIPIDFTGGVPPYGQNVVIVALMLAYYLGCNPVYFIGCDHDFMKISQEDYEKRLIDHFYEDDRPPETLNWLSWDVWQSSMATMDFQYAQLKSYASRWGFEVFNATPGGCLDHFPRVNFESLFTQISTSRTTVHTKELYRLSELAIALIEGGNHDAALILLEDVIRNNINRSDKVLGLDYLKAASLAKADRYHEALVFANQDFSYNLENRANSVELIKQLKQAINKGVPDA